MKKLKRVFCLLLTVFLSVCFFSGCAFCSGVLVPKDSAEIDVITSKGTYIKEENRTSIFVALNIANGKERDIERYELDLVVHLKDGTIYQDVLAVEEDVMYTLESLQRFTFYADGNVDYFEIVGYRVEFKSYWGSFGKLVLSSCAVFFIIGLIFVAFLAGDMTGWLSVGSGAIVLFDAAMFLFIPFANSIIFILASALAFIPMLVYNWIGY